jgi:hypothetical protein
MTGRPDDATEEPVEAEEFEPSEADEVAVGEPADGEVTADDDVDELGQTAAADVARPAGTARRTRSFGRSAPARPATASETAVRVDDRVSAVFVVATVVVFALILLNGIVAGRGGFLTPIATPTPVPSLSAAPSGSPSAAPSASGSVVPSASPSAPASLAASASPVASPS